MMNGGSNGSRGGEKSLPTPELAFAEISLGERIGRGGFSFVSEINSVRLQEIYDTGNDEAKSRAAFAKSVNEKATSDEDEPLSPSESPSPQSSSTSSQKGKTERGGGYVLKTLRPDLPEDEHNKGIIDLAVEARFLAALDHPNVIALRAAANSDPLESRYFVVLDRLASTLDERLKEWRRDVGINMGYWLGNRWGYCCARTHVLHRIWVERLRVGRDVAGALRYLHNQGIVYRDLKPDNVGFDASGQLKMFDFGLAKRITNAERVRDDSDQSQSGGGDDNDDLYKLTGNTGSLRYMAPEVALGKPYNLTVDAYSFGVLFWQIMALTTPYSGYSCKMHAELVVSRGYRPKPDGSWPTEWARLMTECWSSDRRRRPGFEHILEVMEKQLEELEKDGDDDSCANEATEGSAEGFGNDSVNGGLAAGALEMVSKDAGKMIRSRKSKTTKNPLKFAKSLRIRARKDGQRLDTDTRLSKDVVGDSPTTERRTDGNVV